MAETFRSRPPVAPRIDKVIEQAGRTRNDPYAWIKADNWQAVMQDPGLLPQDIRDYLEAENAYTKTRLVEPTADLQAELFAEMKGRMKEDDASVPVIDGPWAYYTRYREGGEYAIMARRPADRAFDADAPETVLLDGNVLSAGLDYFAFGSVAHSPDHRYVAYALDDSGSEFYEIRVRDIATGKDLPLRIRNANGGFVWSADSRSLFWVYRNDSNRPEKVFRRAIDSAEDHLVYHETDPGFFLNVGASQSRDFIFVRAGDHTTTEYRILRSDAPADAAPVLFAAREPGLEYEIEDQGGRFVILTNADDAVDFKIMVTPHDAVSRENWRDLVPHRPGALVLEMAAYRDWLVRLERRDSLPHIVVSPAAGGEEFEIAFDEAAYDLSINQGEEYATDILRFVYASPATPDETFDYDMRTRSRVLRKTRSVPSGHHPADYVVERMTAPAHDGVSIPVTILRRRTTPLDGTAPLLLYGYGSYGITVPADFRTARLSLVDRGFIYAIAHIRGSQARGYQWYLDGKLDKKTNTFLDYVSAARHLAGSGYGSSGRIIGMGGSAGGLLMGAAANMAPDLFGGFIAAVPFVDVLNTMSDKELPLTPPEWPEWGNPIASAEDYDQILSWSPYDNVADRPYPPMLITGGLTDPRVTYWEPAKWAARLRHDAPGGGPYFLRINMGAGHQGASGRFEGLRETALEFAFALSVAGLAEETVAPVRSQSGGQD